MAINNIGNVGGVDATNQVLSPTSSGASEVAAINKILNALGKDQVLTASGCLARAVMSAA